MVWVGLHHLQSKFSSLARVKTNETVHIVLLFSFADSIVSP